MADNDLSSDKLPNFSHLPDLEELRLNGNRRIDTIPDTLVSASAISLLELSQTGLSNLREIERLKNLAKLVNLGLRGTALSEGAAYREAVCEEFQSFAG